jgi:uncharacterized protein YukE
MKVLLADEEITHPLNEVLLQEAAGIKVEQKTLKERLDKLNQSHEGVSQSVYKKVQADYVTKLNNATERLTKLKSDLETEYKLLVEKKNLVEVNLTSHKENIEESHLRLSLGELTKDQHKETIERENKEQKRLEAALKNLKESLERHQEIYEGEELTDFEPAATPTSSAAPQETTRVRLSQATTERVTIEPELESTAKTATPPPSSKDSKKKGAEILILEKGKVIQSIPIEKTIQIGRSPANDIVLKEAKVSRKHAEIHNAAGKYVLMDLESSNGTFVGSKKITEYTLQPGDEIVIGNTKMVFKQG